MVYESKETTQYFCEMNDNMIFYYSKNRIDSWNKSLR
jgi:hypothetical protein